MADTTVKDTNVFIGKIGSLKGLTPDKLYSVGLFTHRAAGPGGNDLLLVDYWVEWVARSATWSPATRPRATGARFCYRPADDEPFARRVRLERLRRVAGNAAVCGGCRLGSRRGRGPGAGVLAAAYHDW